MFGRASESRAFVIALSGTILVVGGFFIFAAQQSPRMPLSVNATDTNSAAHPSSGQVPVAQHKSGTATPPVIETVFECRGDQGLVLSDQPCGSDAQLREISAPNRMIAEPIARPRRLPAPERGRSTVVAAGTTSPGGNAAACASIETEIEKINARMRQQYSSQEGELWRARLRVLSEQRWDAKCRFL